jgi:hypothetical protein
VVGGCVHNLNPVVTHSLKGAWLVTLEAYEVMKTRFQSVLFKCSLHRYTADRHRRGCVQAESSCDP